MEELQIQSEELPEFATGLAVPHRTEQEETWLGLNRRREVNHRDKDVCTELREPFLEWHLHCGKDTLTNPPI